jgi:DeoR/GlpR family transcriptional regulator of sugar metabolism
MLTPERHHRIVGALRMDGVASVRDLAARLNVSESTIRRDLKQLDENGELVRTHGGAFLSQHRAAANAVPEETFTAATGVDAELKDAVAAKAAELVPDDSVVVLDIGTTTPLVARRLRGRPVTVITSSLAVLDELREDDKVRVVLLGGVLRRNYQTLVGSLTQQALAQVSADIMFLSCTGVRPNGHVVDDMAVEAPIKQAMIEAASKVVLLATARKFPGTGSLRVCTLADIDVLVTTDGADRSTTEQCVAAGGQVVIA